MQMSVGSFPDRLSMAVFLHPMDTRAADAEPLAMSVPLGHGGS